MDAIEVGGLGKRYGRKCRNLNLRWGHDRGIAA